MNDALSPSDLAEIARQLRALNDKLDRLLPPAPDPVGDALGSLDRACCRLRGAGSQLNRTVRRRLEDHLDPAGALESKGRLPKVCKSLTVPGEGEALLRRAQASLDAGPHSYSRFLDRERARAAEI